ncbi:MAG: type II toxin-antitoxin system PemK/MazF family toxin [Cyanobacteria bacterium J06600_6]
MDLVSYPHHGEVWLVSLEPTVGSEIRKTRPCVVISPDEINRLLRTVIVAPLTTTIKNYPTRVTVAFQEKEGSIALDQIRSVDKSRLLRKLGNLSKKESQTVSNILITMFSQ